MRRKKSPLAIVLGVTLTSIWKGGAHEDPTRSTVQPAGVPGQVDARGDGGAPWLAPQASRRGAAAGDDTDQAAPILERVSGAPVHLRRAAADRGVHRRAVGEKRSQ